MEFPKHAIKEPIGHIFEDRLARSLGLDDYRYIMNAARDGNIDLSADTAFQKTFNRYYVVRKSQAFRDIYYTLFEECKAASPSFEDILTELNERHGTVEASFASKMVATLNDSKPILDSVILGRFGLAVKGSSPKKRLDSAIAVYHQIEDAYEAFIRDGADEWIAAFDRALPDYRSVSDVKKIDTMLWCMG